MNRFRGAQSDRDTDVVDRDPHAALGDEKRLDDAALRIVARRVHECIEIEVTAKRRAAT